MNSVATVSTGFWFWLSRIIMLPESSVQRILLPSGDHASPLVIEAP